MNLNIFHWRSLQTRATVFALAIFLISIWSLAFYASRMLHEEMDQLSGDQQFSTVSLIAAQVNQELDGRLRTLKKVAARISPALMDNPAALQAYLAESPALQNLFNAGNVIFNAEGTAIADFPVVPGRVGVAYRQLSIVRAALDEGRSSFGKPILSKTTSPGDPVIGFGVPIRNERGKVIGVAAGVTNLAKPNFMSHITESRYGRTGGYMLVVPQDRLIVTATDKRLVMTPASPPGAEPLIDRFIRGYEGSGIQVNPQGVEELVSAKGVPAAGWYVAASLPTEEAFAPIHDTLRYMLRATIFLTLLAGVLTWWMLRRQLAPLLSAAKTLAALSDTNQPPQPLPVVRQDEIGQLIGGFNRLLTTLAQGDKALRESESRFRALVDNSPVCIHEIGMEGRITSMNKTGLLMMGAADESTVRGTLYLDAVCPEDRGRIGALLARAYAGEASQFEFKASGPSGQFFSSCFVPIRNNEGAVERLMGITDDISERKRTESLLQQSEARYRALVEWTPEAVAVHRGGTLIYVNPALVRMMGASSAQQLLGKPFLDFVHPEFRQIVLERVRKCSSDGVAAPAIEEKLLKLDGTEMDAEVQNTSIIYDGEAAVQVAVRDMTERRRSEAELRTLFRAIEQSPASIVITNRAGDIEYVNPRFEEVTGYTRAEALGKNPRILKSENTPAETYSDLWKAISEGGEWRGELCNRRKNGELFFEFAAISGVRGEKGEIEHYIAVKEDITARRQAEAARASLEAQLREAQKMQAIGTLAGGIAHDFNNIIATILGNLELARQDASANPQALESLEEIGKASARARDLVQQILSFSRRQPTERKLTVLAPVVEESARLLRATLPARVTIDVHCDAAVPAVLADATLIEQLLINLATNAVAAMHGRPGRIGIRLDTVMLDAAWAEAHPALQAMHARRQGRTVRLAVSDDGAGMSADVRGRIFEPFFTTKPAGEGTGLGLSVVHGVVQVHEGAIEVDSQAGKGTSFAIYLPAAEAQAGAPQSEAGAAATAPAPRLGSGQHILYIDDDEALVFLVQRLLARRGFRVSGYINQRAALDALVADPSGFDLVVSDYNMPGMSGLDVAREVRAIRAELPVAVASGFIDEELRAQAGGAGVRELIFKADAVEELCEAFARLAQTVGTATHEARLRN